MYIHGKVTKEDIKLGDKGKCVACPIARSIQRETGGPAYVGFSLLWLSGYQGGPEFKTSRAMRRFITRFDSGKPVKPFSYRIWSNY